MSTIINGCYVVMHAVISSENGETTIQKWAAYMYAHFDIHITGFTISYTESSGSLASGWSPGETLGYWNFVTAGFQQ